MLVMHHDLSPAKDSEKHGRLLSDLGSYSILYVDCKT